VQAPFAGSIEGTGRLFCLGALLVVAFTALLGASSAQADPAVRTYKTAASGIEVPSGSSRVAVEPGTGNILILAGSSITVRAPDGSTTLGSILVSGTPAGLATDPGTGAVYFADSAGTITRYLSDGAPNPTYAADPTFTSPPTGSGTGEIAAIADLAVDPSTHDLLVVDPSNDRVSRLSSTGAYLSDFSGASAPSGGFASATDIDVGPTGEILVLAAGHVDRFSSAGAAAGELIMPGSPVSVAINPTIGTILVAGDGGIFSVPNAYFYDDSSAAPSVIPYAARTVSVPPWDEFGMAPLGIAIDGSSSRAYGIYYDIIAPLRALEILDAAVKPGVDISSPTAVSATGMHLHGTVDSGENGTLPAAIVEGTAYFELTSPGVPTVRTPDQNYTATPGLQSVDADVTGLVPNSTYSVKLVAQNARLSNETPAKTATTTASAPAATTGAATDVTGTSAALHGSVAAYGLQTSYYFEYGETTAYGDKVPAGIPGAFGVSYLPRPVQRTIEGLKSGATYHYRLVATNSVGTTFGSDATFMATPAESARGFEMVTPTDKGGGTIDTNFGFQARADGEALIFQPTAAFATVEGSTSGAFHLKYLSRRGSTGWGFPWQVDPPINTTRHTIAVETTWAVSEDFSHALVASNRKLTPDALTVEGTGGADLYVRDTTTGSYSFVGGSTDSHAFALFTDAGQVTKYLGGSTDFSSVVFESPSPLTPDADAGALGIYRWSAAGLELISKLPDGSVATGVVQRPGRALRQLVSGDGRRVVFSVSGTAEDDGVYLWEDGQTRAISVSQRPGDPDTVRPGSVAGISRDGRYVTFSVTSEDPLTVDAEAQKNEIYRLDLAPGQGGLVDLVANGPNIGVVNVSEDGSHVYLSGQPTPADLPGWYVWGPEGVQHVSGDPGVSRQSILSPNGRYFAFTSTNKLTSLDNASKDAVYLFDAESGQLTCASCPQDGSPTTGNAQLSDTEIAVSNRYPRAVIDDGRLFFHTETRLVAGDVNDSTDVYSFRNGRATLISPGTGPYPARFMDASADGRDVFFATTQPLSSRDKDEDFDFYDARVGGGDPALEPRTQCGGDCGAAAIAPTAASSATQTTASKVERHKHKHRKKHTKKKRKEAAKHTAHRTAHTTDRHGK
jgi:hypothetical protein